MAAARKEYRWSRQHRSVGTLGDCWQVFWSDPEQKYHTQEIGRADTLKEVYALIAQHRSGRATARQAS